MLANSPYTPVVLSPYRAGVCWFGVRAAKSGEPQRYCGCGAGRYRVTKHMMNALESSVDIREVWLCYKHVTAMEERGYCCHALEE